MKASNIELIAVSALVPYARNSRTHSAEQIAQIAASIGEFGWTNPVLIDDANGIIAGAGRVMAAKLRGLEQVPRWQNFTGRKAERDTSWTQMWAKPFDRPELVAGNGKMP